MAALRFTIAERRRIHLMKEVGSNFNEWKDDAADRYFKTPKGAYERTMGVVGAGVSTVTELPDYLIAGAVDKRINAERFNTIRDVRETAGDIIKLRPLKAIAGAFRLPGSMIRDSVVLAGGLHGSRDNYSQAA